MLALLSVLFIGSLAFVSNIKAFALHSLPTFIVCLWLGNHESWLRMCYSIALPMVAVGIHHVLQRRNDHFAQALLCRLLEERATLSDLSMMDPLTGLYNRRGLQSRLENLPAQDSGEHFVLLLDIDHFKKVNDTYGHTAGDEVIKSVSRIIRDNLRQQDMGVRYGGEEFLVFLEEVPETTAYDIAERLRKKVGTCHEELMACSEQVTISAGVAHYRPSVDKNIEACIHRADVALYYSKRNGRNRTTCASEIEQLEQ